jgi:Tfp pilus assembly protein FimT
VRFTLRRLLIVIALLAVLIAAGLEGARATRRAREYRQIAVAHAAFRDLSLGEAEAYRYVYIHKAPADSRAGTDLLRSEAKERALARHYEALSAKYRRAARFPWLPVEPDPPQPH